MSVANVAAVDAALIAVLAADAELTALVPDGIWRDVAPAGSTRAVTVQLQTHEDIEGFRMPLYEEFRYRIVAHVLETTGVAADAAAARIHALLQDAVLTPITGYTHMATLRVEVVRTQDPDTGDNDLRWQLAGGDYEITVSPDTGEPPGVAYADLVVADGASHYWRLGEPSGTITVDAIGTAHGTMSGGVTPGVAGATTDGNPAMTFDGMTGKVTTAALVTIPVAGSLEVWLKPVDNNRHTIIGIGNERPVLYSEGGAIILYENGVPDGAKSTVAAVPVAAWHHVVCVFTGTTLAFYLDGVLDSSTTFTRPSPVPGAANLGNDPVWGADPIAWWLGSLDEVAIYPHALTPAQIAAHYTAATTATRSPRFFRHRKD